MQLYPIACEAGIDAAAFWDMTYLEIVVAIRSYGRQLRHAAERQQAELRIQAILAYRHADVLGAIVSKIAGGKGKVPTIYEAFPGIFPEEARPLQQNWQLMKARVETYAAERRKQVR